MVEDVLEEMKRLIETHLPAELDKQDGKYADSIILEDVKTVTLGERQIPETGLPAIVLVPEFEEQVEMATAIKYVTYRINIGIVVSDTDNLSAYRKLWRTIRAVENVMEVHGRAGPIVSYQSEGIDYDAGPFDTRNVESLVKAGVLVASIRERLDAYNASQV